MTENININENQIDKIITKCKEEKNILIEEDVVDVKLNDDGIEYLLLKDGRKIVADYFFDCTGFERMLIGKLTNFKRYDDMIADSFIVGSIPRTTIRPYTVSIAKKNGWQWEIDTKERRNSGYVYCSSLISDEEAQKESLLSGTPRRFQSGQMKDLAIKNVISNGLAQSFIEPLEATSIMIAIFTVEFFVKSINISSRSFSYVSISLKIILFSFKIFIIIFRSTLFFS